MSFSSSRIRVLLLVLAALAVLTACNPLTLRRNGGGNYVARYSGPSGGWLEVSITEPQGLEVTFNLLVQGEDESARICRDAATGAAENCNSSGGLHLTDSYAVTTTAFRPVFSPFDNDLPIVLVGCSQGGGPVTCPALPVTMRAVDAGDALVGDLTDQTPA
jgi:hypothetical protein